MVLIVWLVVSGLVAVMLESSFLALPWVLWLFWWWSGRVSWSGLIWVGMALGIVLDILLVRTLGISAIGLWLFGVGLLLIRQWFVGRGVAERLWMVTSSVGWSYYFAGVRGVFGLAVVLVLSLVVIELGKKFNLGKEIRLIN